jgi:hypothetical protein
MVRCLSCGAEVPEGFAFCGQCGAPLTAGPRVEERRVVTVLFCDLAGFTARADQADPEDVRALLRPYHARLRHEIERFGGTVDKFIGDGVMGVFGVPSAHEDDPERAVRCALAVLEAAEELELTERFLAGADAPAARYRHCVAAAHAVLAETKGDLEVAHARPTRRRPTAGGRSGSCSNRATPCWGWAAARRGSEARRRPAADPWARPGHLRPPRRHRPAGRDRPAARPAGHLIPPGGTRPGEGDQDPTRGRSRRPHPPRTVVPTNRGGIR